MSKSAAPPPFLGRFSVAPMLDWTDRHCRYFHRLLSRHALLYTEMITADAILHSKTAILAQPEAAYPIALQLGGSHPKALAQCAKQAEQYGYAEVNLNVGCPSNRVQQGRFGACLMADAPLVADCIKAMRDQVILPVTVKTRLGIDQQDNYLFLADFIDTVANQGGCKNFIIHARKAWLSGLSPKENRTRPPIDYQRVYHIKRDFPHLNIAINGEIQTLAEIQTHLTQVDGVMIGRAAYKSPLLLRQIERELFDPQAVLLDGITVIEALYPYIEKELKLGTPLNTLVRPLMGLFHQHVGARQWRRYLSEHCYRSDATLSVVQQALQLIRTARLQQEKAVLSA